MSQIVTRSNTMAVPPQDGPSGEGAAAPSTSKASASKGKKNIPNETESPRHSLVDALQNEYQITVHQNAIDNQIVQNMGGASMDMGDPNGSLSSDYNDEDHDDIIDSDGPQDDLSLGGGWMQSTPPRIKLAVKIF